ncbi:MAG: molybdenum ABC transporter ATP-binding protein [Limibacillus sp.]
MTLEVSIRQSLRHFSLEVAFETGARGITALFGPSGAGKSSTVEAIAGLRRGAEGRIALDGRVLLDSGAKVFLPPEERRVGCVFQDARLFPHLSVRSNLLYGWRRSRQRAPEAEIDGVIALLGLEPLLARSPGSLSGGEKQRLALGRALLMKPDLLLLDEPLAALDQNRKGEILPFLERLRDESGVPMVYVSHSIEEVTRLADRMVVMNEGKVAAEGTVFEITARLDLFPLTGRYEAGAVIECRVTEQDPAFSMTRLSFTGGSLWVPEIELPKGAEVRVRLRARDIILAKSAPNDISVNNVLEGVIKEIREDQSAFVDVQVDCGGTLILARITKRSLQRLGLGPGQSVFALAKTVTIDRRAMARTR